MLKPKIGCCLDISKMYALNNIYNCTLGQLYKHLKNITECLKSRGYVAVYHFLRVSLFGKAWRNVVGCFIVLGFFYCSTSGCQVCCRVETAVVKSAAGGITS